jgi:subtilase family serine protease
VEQLEERALPSTAPFALPFTPQQIRHAYAIDQVQADGTGQTIAIVDAFHDPTIVSDLANFSSKFGLPLMDGKGTDPTFTQLDQSKQTLSPPGDDWTIETALDVEWAHAIAPKANILLVEAASDNVNSAGVPIDLLNAVNTARNTPGVVVVSMSWGLNEWSGERNYDSYFTTPAGHTGVTFVAASGDSGAPPIWPAISPNVVAVGGTTLTLNATTGAYSSETGWGSGIKSWKFGGSGGGFSQYEPKPAYQSSVTQSSVHRTNPDIAFNADPNTGYFVLDQAIGGWYEVGGTSAGAPQIAAMVALADQLRGPAGSLGGASQTLPALYKASSKDFHDITSGNNGYPAAPGYDLITGRGTPIANLLIPDLANAGPATVEPSSKTSTSVSSGSLTPLAVRHFSHALERSDSGELHVVASKTGLTGGSVVATLTVQVGIGLLRVPSSLGLGVERLDAALDGAGKGIQMHAQRLGHDLNGNREVVQNEVQRPDSRRQSTLYANGQAIPSSVEPLHSDGGEPHSALWTRVVDEVFALDSAVSWASKSVEMHTAILESENSSGQVGALPPLLALALSLPLGIQPVKERRRLALR